MAEQFNTNEKAAQTAFMCQFCNQQNVKWKCMDCDIFLCNSCKEKIHKKLKSADKHRILSIEEIGKIQCYDNEPWYHGKMTGEEAEILLQKYKFMGDGAFIIRESASSIGNYALDFLMPSGKYFMHVQDVNNKYNRLNGKPFHNRILTTMENGQLMFNSDGQLFSSLYKFVECLKNGTHVMSEGVSSNTFTLTKHIPKITMSGK